MNELLLAERIATERKRHGFTQEMLADKLGISFQAVSKWENGQSCPDIGLLPKLADIFGITLDALFGRETVPLHVANVPWEDDNTLRAVFYLGRRLVDKTDNLSEVPDFTFKYEGDPLNVECWGSLKCEGNILGSVTTGHSVSCSSISKNVTAGHSVSCAEIGGSVTAGHSISLNGSGINGSVSAGHSINCGDIEGNVNCQRLTCNSISGDVRCDGRIHYR